MTDLCVHKNRAYLKDDVRDILGVDHDKDRLETILGHNIVILISKKAELPNVLKSLRAVEKDIQMRISIS